MDDLRREMEPMAGEGFLFSTFPTETVKANMSLGGVKASDAEIERLWTAYQKGSIEKHFPAFTHKQVGGGSVAAPWVSYLEAETGYPRMTIAAYLNGVEKAVKEQGWDWRWLDPAAARDAGLPLTVGESVSGALKGAGESVGNFLKPTLDPVTNLVKYASIALVAGAVIYGVYHGTKVFKVFKAKRRKKG